MIVTLIVGLFAAGAGALVIAQGTGFSPQWSPFTGGERHTVQEVISGDAIEVTNEDGDVFQVRMLGVNAPAVSSEEGEPECGAGEAVSFVRDQIPTGSHVFLVGDSEAADRDDDGRVLRYVETWFGTDIGHEVLDEGYGVNWSMRTGPKFERGDEYRLAALFALEHGKGTTRSCPAS